MYKKKTGETETQDQDPRLSETQEPGPETRHKKVGPVKSSNAMLSNLSLIHI